MLFRSDHILQAVADPQNRQAEIENRFFSNGRVFVIHRRRAARQNDADGRVTPNFIQRSVAGKNHRKDVLFADAAGDELGILRAEVEDND